MENGVAVVVVRGKDELEGAVVVVGIGTDLTFIRAGMDDKSV